MARDAECDQAIENAGDAGQMPRPGRWRHFKGGLYEVIGVATHSENGEQLVVYRPLYGARGLWVRPLGMFSDIVEREGKRVQRFERIGD
jgi:hypothetical protein